MRRMMTALGVTWTVWVPAVIILAQATMLFRWSMHHRRDEHFTTMILWTIWRAAALDACLFCTVALILAR